MRLDIHPYKTIDEARNAARVQIDAAAGRARSRYITITPGQDATYQAKYADAQAFVRADYPEDKLNQYPWVQGEAQATGTTGRVAADAIKTVGDPWNNIIGPAIEKLRIEGKTRLAGIESIGEVVRHVREIQKLFDAV